MSVFWSVREKVVTFFADMVSISCFQVIYMNQSDKMLVSEYRAALALALVYVFRILGLFMVLPVLALYADSLSGATPILLGFAVGAYGFDPGYSANPFWNAV